MTQFISLHVPTARPTRQPSKATGYDGSMCDQISNIDPKMVLLRILAIL